MFDGEYTHQGELCTFEVLLARFEIADAALRHIAEIVHDIDLKDEKHGRRDTAGFEALVNGIAMAHREDEARLARAGGLDRPVRRSDRNGEVGAVLNAKVPLACPGLRAHGRRGLVLAPLLLLTAQRRREDFPGEIVAVLLGPEPAPAVMPHLWDLRAEDPTD